MYRTDYIIRLIERFGHSLRVLRDRILKRQTESEEARAEIHELAREAGLDVDVARHLDPGVLLMWLSPTGEVDPPRFWLLAELLYLEALAARSAEAGDRGRSDLVRARAIFERLPPEWRPADTLASAGERCQEIEAMLESNTQQ